MKIFSSKALGLSAATALIVVGGGTAHADWEKVGVGTPLNLALPMITVSVQRYGDTRDQDNKYDARAATATQRFKWVGENAPPTGVVLAGLAVTGDVSTSLSTTSEGHARATLSDGESVKTFNRQTGQIDESSRSVPRELVSKATVNSTPGPNGDKTRYLEAAFPFTLNYSAYVKVGRYMTYNANREGVYVNSGDATATATAATAKTIDIAVVQ